MQSEKLIQKQDLILVFTSHLNNSDREGRPVLRRLALGPVKKLHVHQNVLRPLSVHIQRVPVAPEEEE